MQKLLARFLLFFIVLNTIIRPYKVQAMGEQYHLDRPTVERGFPVVSEDKRFTLLVWPNVFRDAVDIELTRFTELPMTGEAYTFQINSKEELPFLRQPLTVVFDTVLYEAYRYKRLYYFHRDANQWLSLKSHVRHEDKKLIGRSIDFIGGTVGMFVDNTPLPDRLFGTSLDEPQTGTMPEDTMERFTMLLQDDIIRRGYTLNWQGAAIAIQPGVLQTASEVTMTWQKSGRVFDFNFSPKKGEISPLSSSKNLFLQLPVSTTTMHEKAIAIWDKRISDWRELPSNYLKERQLVSAFTPFYFGSYRVQDRRDVYRGKASWFPDEMISKTRYAAASNDYPLGTMVYVLNMENNKQVKVEIVSVGPFAKERIIDLTKTAFAALASPRQGVLDVRVERVN